MEILYYLIDHFADCWKAHADAPVPSFDEEKINVFEFNHNAYDPLRCKYYCAEVINDTLVINWECQEEWSSDLYGMQEEINRWAKYWINKYNDKIDTECIKINVNVQDRDKFKSDTIHISILIK